MSNFSDYCRECTNLLEHCTCNRGGGKWFTRSGNKKLTYEESEEIRKKSLKEKNELGNTIYKHNTHKSNN